jgi:hypothetical protein
MKRIVGYTEADQHTLLILDLALQLLINQTHNSHIIATQDVDAELHYTHRIGEAEDPFVALPQDQVRHLVKALQDAPYTTI